MPADPEPLVFEAHGATDVGGRRLNDDALLLDQPHGLFVLVDGVAGNPGGAHASRIVADTVATALTRLGVELDQADADLETRRRRTFETVQSALSLASERIYRDGNEHAELKGMAASALVLKRVGDSFVLGHVGNGRAWLLRKRRLYRLTEEHTFAWRLVRQGAMREEDVASSPYRNVLVRAIGKYPSVDVDLLRVELVPGDVLMLGSWGFASVVDEEELVDFAAGRDAAGLVHEAMAAALKRRPWQNVTLVALRTLGGPSDDVLPAAEHEVAFLRAHALFRDLGFPELARVLRVVEEVPFEAGVAIVSEGEESRALHVVLSGRLLATRRGRKLLELGPSGHFGAIEVVAPQASPATVTAQEPSLLLRIDRDRFDELCRDEPAIANKLLTAIVRDLGARPVGVAPLGYRSGITPLVKETSR